MSTLKKVLESIRNAADDITTLDVVTLTGSVTITGLTDQNNEIDLKALNKAIQKNAIANTNMTLLAYTHIDLDSDTIHFVKSGLSEGEAPLVEAHNAMVKSSQDARLAFVKAVKDVVGL